MICYNWPEPTVADEDNIFPQAFARTFLSPQGAADDAEGGPRLAAMPDGRRSLLLTPHVARGTGTSGYDTQPLFDMALTTGLATILKSGAHTTDTINWITDYLAILASDYGITSIDEYVLDSEFGPTFDGMAGLGVNGDVEVQFQDVWDDAAAQALLSKNIIDYVEAERSGPGAEGAVFASGGTGGETTGVTPRSAFNRFFVQIREQWLYTAFVDTFRDVIGQPALPVSDFNKNDQSRLFYDQNGFRNYSNAIGQSSPVFYPSISGARYNTGDKDPYWRVFVDSVNHCRNSLQIGSDVIPWLNNPSRADATSAVHNQSPWLWRELIRHMAYMGIERVLGFMRDVGTWASPGLASWAADMAYAQAAFVEAETIIPVSYLFDAMDLDVDEVVTGRYRTTYADFLVN